MNKVIRILHLEDVQYDADLVQRELKKGDFPYELLWVSDRSRFEKALDGFQPDIVLCDHSLPSYTSLDAIQAIRARGFHIPFVLITATMSEEFVVEMIKQGVDDYIIKDRLWRLPSAVLNVIQRKNAEKEKEKYLSEIISKEKRFRALIENLSEAIVLCDKSERITFHSPAAAGITGLSGEQINGKIFYSLFHPEDESLLREIFRQSAELPAETVNISFRFVEPGGTVKWLEGSVSNSLHDENVKAFIINFHNITARKKAEQLQRKSEANLRAIFDNTRIAYILLDSQLKIISYNNRSQDYFEKEFKKQLREGETITVYFPDERGGLMNERFERALQGEVLNYQSNFKQADGSLNWYNVEMLPVLHDHDEAMGLIITLEDITERKNIEIDKEKMTSDLLQHNKNLEQFAYIISHNLRSPVANIIGLSNLIQSSPGMSDSDFNRCMEGLALSVKKLDDIIVDLNYILQMRREIDEKKETVRLASLVKDIKTSISNLIDKEKISIKTNFSAVSEIFTIKSYLNSIFYNLISNSIKYRHPGHPSVIEISSKRADNKILITFRDNGLGIDLKANQNKIFGLYKKFHPQIEGKGMGLYMVKTQVEILGGSIHVNSEVNKGTEFLIEFNA
jgi:PAS domain S-box-containing protein